MSAVTGWWRGIERIHRAVLAHRRLIATLVYVGVTIVAYWGAFFLRYELAWPTELTPLFAYTLPILLALRIGFSYAFRLGLGRWRFVGPADLIRLCFALVCGSALFFAATWTLPFVPRVPRSVLLL